MTPEEQAEWARLYAEEKKGWVGPGERRTPHDTPDVVMEREAAALEGATEKLQAHSLYDLGPQATAEEMVAHQATVEQRAAKRVQDASAVVRTPGHETAWYDQPLGRSRLVVGTGGKVMNEETGQLEQAGSVEQVWESLFKKRIAETGHFDEKVRAVREGEMTREEADLPEWVDLNVPLSKSGIEEPGYNAALRFLGAFEPPVAEAVFGGDRLFYSVDADGVPNDPDSWAARGERWLKENFPDYADQPFAFPGLQGNPSMGLAGEEGKGTTGPGFATLPRPFQATTRHQGLFAAPSEGDFVARVADQIAEGRALGHEFEDLTAYREQMDEHYAGAFGMSPAFLAGTAYSTLIPTPIGPAFSLLKGTGRVAAGAARAGATASGVAGLHTVADALQPWETAKRLANRAAARKAVGVDISDIRDPLAAPTLRSEAVRRAVGPMAAAVDLKAQAANWMEEGLDAVNHAAAQRAYEWNPAAKEMLDKAFQMGDEAMQAANVLDPRALDVVVDNFSRAADYKVLADGLQAGDLTLGQVVARVRKFNPSGAKQLGQATQQEAEAWLRKRLAQAGQVPNTKNGFVNGLYAKGRAVMDDIAAGVKPAEMLTRSLKGMGATGRLFQDTLLRTIMEEALGQGKGVARILGEHAREVPTPARLRTMIEALGDGAGRRAIASAFHETMITVGRDRILQHLPDDFVFVSGKMMVAERFAKETRRAIDRMARALFTVSTTPTGRLVTAAGDTTVDDLVRLFTQEAGPVAAGAGPGSSAARGVLRKLKAGTAMDEVEHAYFAEVMRDAVARMVAPGIATEAVTEGAQTALARNSVGLRNALYTDAYSGMSVGRLARAARTSLAALGELMPVVRKAQSGNVAASLLLAPAEEGITPGSMTKFLAWSKRMVTNASNFVRDPLYGYKPESSVISETYARQIADAVGSAGDRLIDTFRRLADAGISGPRAVSQVVADMGDEVDAMVRQRFNRALLGHLEGRGDDIADAIKIQEAELAARYMVRQVSMVAKEGKFKGGEGPINEALIAMGFRAGLEDVRQLPAEDAVVAIREAAVRVLAEAENAEGWVNLMKTLIPGKAALEFVTKPLDQREVNMLLSEAIDVVRRRRGARLDGHGNLLPNIENSKAVLLLLSEKNGSKFLDSTLQYSGALSMFSNSGSEWVQAWQQGLLSWLTHQRAGLDAGRLFTRMADENPEVILDLVPAHAHAARELQFASVQSVVEEMLDIEARLMGVAKASLEGKYNQAWAEAEMVLRAREDAAGLQLGPLARAIFNTMKQMERLDFNLKPEQRIALGTSVMRRMAQGRGLVPDLGSIGHRLVEELVDYEARVVPGLSDDASKNLGTYGGATAGRHEISANFHEHMVRVRDARGSGVQIPDGMFVARLEDALYSGVLSGAEDSLLGPVYRQYDRMWRRAGLRLDAGDLPGLDGPIISAMAVQAQYGPSHVMAGTHGMHAAVNRVQTAVASGRLQASLEELSVKAKLADEGKKGTPAEVSKIVGTAVGQALQTTVRVTRSTTLAGGGLGLAFAPHPLYHAGNVQSVPELLTATLGAEMALEVGRHMPEGAASAARNARSAVFRSTIAKALAPGNAADDVVMNTAFYGDITARELDEMMDLAGIKFSRASIEAYESMGEQMAEAAKLNLRFSPEAEASGGMQFLRMFNPAAMHEWMKFAEDTDGITRRATFIAALADGRTMDEAAMLARESLLDYGKVAASGSGFSRFMQRWTMFWAFRRQSLIMTMNNLADGKFGRQEMMGRWIKMQGRQKQGASPEEFLFGPDYIKFRMYATPSADDVGFVAGAPSVLGEGAGELLGWLAMFGTAFAAVAEGDEDEQQRLMRSTMGQFLEAVENENLDIITSSLAEAVMLAGRMDERGPLVSDVLIAQVLAFDQRTGANAFPAFKEFFGLVEDRDPETGHPVVTPNRPYVQSEGEIAQAPHQFRFETKGGYLLYMAVRLLQTLSGAGRAPDEWMKLALTIEALVPEGYQPQYRSTVNIMQYMTRTGTPMRATDRQEQRARVAKTQARGVERAGR